MSEKPMSEGPMSDEQERQRERQELISALRNFAEHFGAAEVYQQARAIYRETPAGKAEMEQAAAASFDAALQRATPGRRAGQGSSLETAKKALGD